MQIWLALFRGVNVGGRNKMPMATLASTLEAAGCQSVRTYIQSGNTVFTSSTKSKAILTKLIRDATEAEFGFRPTVLLLSKDDLLSAIRNNPFPEATSTPKTLHFFFLEAKPNSSALDGIADLASPTERFQLIDQVFYLHASDGIGRSRLAAGAERKLGVLATARNYSTVAALSAMMMTT